VRPADSEAGPPLAAKRLQVRDLPADLKLSDQDAVVPGRVISAYAAVTVIARVSKSGTAAPHDGDLLGQQGWKKASGKPLAIVIDTVLK
jgi:cytochrome c-type biogenesis protein CcmH